MEPYQGAEFLIELADDATDTWCEVQSTATPTCQVQLRRLIERFAEKGDLQSRVQMRNEGDGIYAIKANCGLRAYGYYHKKRRKVFVISHFVHKKSNKMRPADRERAVKNRNSGGSS